MELVVSRCCDDVARRERMLVRHLKRHNEHCPWIGNEYFRAADPSELVAALDTVAPPVLPAQD
jgi:hypothetical protein